MTYKPSKPTMMMRSSSQVTWDL